MWSKENRDLCGAWKPPSKETALVNNIALRLYKFWEHELVSMHQIWAIDTWKLAQVPNPSFLTCICGQQTWMPRPFIRYWPCRFISSVPHTSIISAGFLKTSLCSGKPLALDAVLAEAVWSFYLLWMFGRLKCQSPNISWSIGCLTMVIIFQWAQI